MTKKRKRSIKSYAAMTPTEKFVKLAGLLLGVNGASFISIDTLTNVPLLGGKSNPFQGRVQKMSVGANVMVFQNKNINGYEAMVHRRLIAEGKNPRHFVLSERSWGERIPEMPFVKHHDKGGAVKYYLEVIFLRPPVNTVLLVDGEPYFGTIEGMKDDPQPAEQGGLENNVIIRTFGVDSIVGIKIDGKTTVLQ